VRTTETVAYCALNCKQQRTTGSCYYTLNILLYIAPRGARGRLESGRMTESPVVYSLRRRRHCFIITILLVACYIPVHIRIYRAMIYNITVRHLASVQRARERGLLRNLSAYEETAAADAHVTSIWSIRTPETRVAFDGFQCYAIYMFGTSAFPRRYVYIIIYNIS